MHWAAHKKNPVTQVRFLIPRPIIDISPKKRSRISNPLLLFMDQQLFPPWDDNYRCTNSGMIIQLPWIGIPARNIYVQATNKQPEL